MRCIQRGWVVICSFGEKIKNFLEVHCQSKDISNGEQMKQEVVPLFCQTQNDEENVEEF